MSARSSFPLFEVLVAAAALAAVLAAQWILTTAIPEANYYGNDGKMVQAVIVTAFKFGGYLDVTNLSPIHAMGAQLLPKNVWANPSLWPFAFAELGAATNISALVALGCFASAVYIMARCFDVPIVPSAVAAQASIVLFAPAIFIAYTPTNFCLTPADAVVYAPYMVAIGVLARLRDEGWRGFAAKAIGITALVLYSIYCDPLFTLIAAFSWAMPFAIVTLGGGNMKTVARRAAALACCAAFLVLSGAAEYLYTLSRYTARIHFPETFDRPRGPTLVSAMSYSPTMGRFYLAWAAGWILGLVTLRGQTRVLVLAAAVSCIAWVAYSIVYLLLLNATWSPPIPLYIEQCLFALYTAAAIAGYWGFLRAVAGLAVPLARRLPVGFNRAVRLAGMAAAFPCVVILPWKVMQDGLADRERLAKISHPFGKDPELVGFLSEQVGLGIGAPFRGIVNFPQFEPIGENTILTLWLHNGPTTNQYSQLVTPESVYFNAALVARDPRGQLNRFNMMWGVNHYSPIFWPAVQMLGVRYQAARFSLQTFTDKFPLTAMPHRPVEPGQKDGTWYVYELPHPNVGNYSPTEAIIGTRGAEIMSLLKSPDFDYTRQAVLSAPLAGTLVPARDMKLSLIRGGYHLTGHSDGTSLVVLPQQFSHCLRARAGNVRFVRANLMMTGAVFSGDIDTDIVFDYGIFSPGCRRADLVDLKQLDLKMDLRSGHLTGDRLFPDWNGAVVRLQAAMDAIR